MNQHEKQIDLCSPLGGYLGRTILFPEDLTVCNRNHVCWNKRRNVAALCFNDWQRRQQPARDLRSTSLNVLADVSEDRKRRLDTLHVQEDDEVEVTSDDMKQLA